MPLLPGKKNIGHNIETEQAAGKPHEQAIAIALNTARKHRAEGGGIRIKKIRAPVVRHHVGPIHSSVAGRTDHLPMTVPQKSYVIPADVVSGIGEGNTIAGFKALRRAYGGIPYKSGDAPYGQEHGPYGMMASGGEVRDHDPGVPIVAAGGEWVVHPHHVWMAGGGDIDRGHAVHDEVVKRTRAELVKTLKKLPGPKKD